MRSRFYSILVIVFVMSTMSSSAENLFSTCRFHFGTDNGKATGTLMNEVDYLTAWAGNAEEYNMDSYFKNCKNNNKTPVIVAYVIAFTARRDKSLQDCNVGTPNLCQDGANYLRQNRARIMSQYVKYAKGAAGSFGTTNPMVWCMEPDYTQYTDAGQTGGGLTVAECGTLMNEILDSILKYSPKSVFSMDISPWKDTTWQKPWFEAMKVKSRFTFVSTSGGQSRADQTLISDSWSQACPKWAWVYKTYGTPLLADADYGTAGGSTGYDTRWDNVANLSARITDGVIGVSHYNPSSAATYAATIAGLRSQIPTPPKCPTGTSSVSPRGPRDVTVMQPLSTITGMVEVIDFSGKVLSSKMVAQKTVAWNAWKDDGTLKRGTYIIRIHSDRMDWHKRIVVTE
jgi:hypothetical protein